MAVEQRCQFCGQGADHKCGKAHACGGCCGMMGLLAATDKEAYRWIYEVVLPAKVAALEEVARQTRQECTGGNVIEEYKGESIPNLVECPHGCGSQHVCTAAPPSASPAESAAQEWLTYGVTQAEIIWRMSEKLQKATAEKPDGTWFDDLVQLVAGYAASREAAARFAPLGDNHHNAYACPYCNPEAQAKDAELSAQRAYDQLLAVLNDTERERAGLRAEVEKREAAFQEQFAALRRFHAAERERLRESLRDFKTHAQERIDQGSPLGLHCIPLDSQLKAYLQGERDCADTLLEQLNRAEAALAAPEESQ